MIKSIAIPSRVCKLLQQVQDLRLHGHVEGGCRLVRNQEIGLIGERNRDHHALALATRQLMRVALQPTLRFRNANLAEQIEGTQPRFLPRNSAMQKQGLVDLLLHSVERISAKSSAPER